MPPKKTKGTRKAAPKKKVVREPESASSEHEQEADVHVATEDEDDSEQERPNGPQGTPLKSKLEEAIADFYEANPLFYDKGNPDYKNKEKKRALLDNFCKTVGMGTKPQDITRKFKSHRTEYVKLKRMKKGKSGSGKVSLTSLQRWKLVRYQFLDPYCIIRLPEDLGSVPSTGAVEVGDEEEEVEEAGDEEVVAGTSTAGATPYGSGTGEILSSTGDPKTKRKKGPTTPSIAEILTKFLQQSDKDKKRAQKEVETIVNEAQQPLDERAAWGQWLMSTCLRVPSVHFQQYQRDTFEATLRWMPREPAVPGRPLPDPSTLPPPQRHTPQQVISPHMLSQPLQQQSQQIQQPGFFQMLGGDQQQPVQQHPVMGWMHAAPQSTPAVLRTPPAPTQVTRPSSAPVATTHSIIESGFIESTPHAGWIPSIMPVTGASTAGPRTGESTSQLQIPNNTGLKTPDIGFNTGDLLRGIDMSREREEQPPDSQQ